MHADCAIVIQLGGYKMMSYLNSMMGLTELVIPANINIERKNTLRARPPTSQTG